MLDNDTDQESKMYTKVKNKLYLHTPKDVNLHTAYYEFPLYKLQFSIQQSCQI